MKDIALNKNLAKNISTALENSNNELLNNNSLLLNSFISPASSHLANPQTNRSLQALPYNSISKYYLSTFGEKIYKIPVSLATTCPNREGLRGMKICNFCDVWGSAAYPDLQKKNILEQIKEAKSRILSRVRAIKFLIYFQAYTTSFSKVQILKENIEIALGTDNAIGVVIGTRPDCVSSAFIDLLNELQKKTYVALEFGVQSFSEKQLLWMRRGHTAEKSIQTIHRIKKDCPNINLGIHLILGLPGESSDDVIATSLTCNTLKIDNVKLHNLHVLKNTALESDYKNGLFEPLSRDEYNERVVLFLQYLDPKIAVHRLSALSNHEGELIAPLWTSKKMESYQSILDLMTHKKAYQGQFFSNF